MCFFVLCFSLFVFYLGHLKLICGEGVCSLPGVLSRHDMECMPSEQMENIPMVVILPSDSRQKQFAKKRQEMSCMCYQYKSKGKKWILISTGSTA